MPELEDLPLALLRPGVLVDVDLAVEEGVEVMTEAKVEPSTTEVRVVTTGEALGADVVTTEDCVTAIVDS